MGSAGLPPDFQDRLRDLLSTVVSEQILLRPAKDELRLRRIVKLAKRQTQCEVATLLLVHAHRGDLYVEVIEGPSEVDSLEGQAIARTGVAGFALDDGQPLAVADLSSNATSNSDDELGQRLPIATRNTLAVPLHIHDQACGVLELRNAPGDKGFTPQDVELCSDLGYLAAAAVEEYRTERFLYGLFAAALPHALDSSQTSGADRLQNELIRWLHTLEQSPAWRKQASLVARIRELCELDDDAVDLAQSILDAMVKRERNRTTDFNIDVEVR